MEDQKIGMRERRRRFGFATEALPGHRAQAGSFSENLERHIALQLPVPGPKDDGARSLAQGLAEIIAGNRPFSLRSTDHLQAELVEIVRLQDAPPQKDRFKRDVLPLSPCILPILLAIPEAGGINQPPFEGNLAERNILGRGPGRSS